MLLFHWHPRYRIGAICGFYFGEMAPSVGIMCVLQHINTSGEIVLLRLSSSDNLINF